MNIYLTITVQLTSESLLNEWPLVSLKAICYSLSSRTKIFIKITYSQYRYNVVHYSTILHTALEWLRQKINKKQSVSSNLCRTKLEERETVEPRLLKCSLHHFRPILNIQCTEIRSPFFHNAVNRPHTQLLTDSQKCIFRRIISPVGKTFLMKSLPVPKWCGIFSILWLFVVTVVCCKVMVSIIEVAPLYILVPGRKKNVIAP